MQCTTWYCLGGFPWSEEIVQEMRDAVKLVRTAVVVLDGSSQSLPILSADSWKWQWEQTAITRCKCLPTELLNWLELPVSTHFLPGWWCKCLHSETSTCSCSSALGIRSKGYGRKDKAGVGYIFETLKKLCFAVIQFWMYPFHLAVYRIKPQIAEEGGVMFATFLKVKIWCSLFAAF